MATMTAATAGLMLGIASSASRSTVTARGRELPALKGGLRRLTLHGGLKAQNRVMAMGASASTEQQFADLRARCYARSSSSSSTSQRGGALASTCDLGNYIFSIIPIMTALVLIGVAIGFVLLRIEAAVEDSE